MSTVIFASAGMKELRKQHRALKNREENVIREAVYYGVMRAELIGEGCLFRKRSIFGLPNPSTIWLFLLLSIIAYASRQRPLTAAEKNEKPLSTDQADEARELESNDKLENPFLSLTEKIPANLYKVLFGTKNVGNEGEKRAPTTFKPPQSQKDQQHQEIPDILGFLSDIVGSSPAGANNTVVERGAGVDGKAVDGQAKQLKAGASMILPNIVGMPWQWLDSKEEDVDEETALADAIIHGTKKKKVPRVRTAVDSLVEALEDEQVKHLAKNPRHYQAMRTRLQAQRDEQKAQSPAIPPYFQELARQGAEYWRQQTEARKRKVGTLSQEKNMLSDKLAKVAERRRQKDKLMLWKENQTYQLPEDHPQLEELLLSIFKENQDLELGLIDDMEAETDFWGAEPTDESSGIIVESEKQLDAEKSSSFETAPHVEILK